MKETGSLVKMVITGATGYLGSRIASYYQDEYRIFTPAHEQIDICDKENTRKYLNWINQDIIVHCAAVSDVAECEKNPEMSGKINVLGSYHIASTARELGAKCILCSSDQVYFGSKKPTSHHENESLTPCSEYGKQKLRMEDICLNENPDAVILRLAWMYDIFTHTACEHMDFIKVLMNRLEDEGELCYPIHDKRGITDVNEVVVNIQKLFSLPGGVYNFGAENHKNMYDTVVRVLEKLGIDNKRCIETEMPLQIIREICV